MTDYHDDYNSVSCSMLKVFYESRKEYFLRYIAECLPKSLPTPSMELGQIWHQILLEKVEVCSVVTAYPDDVYQSNGSLNGKAAREYRELMHPRTCVKQDVLQKIHDVVHAVRTSVLADVIDGATSRETRYDGEMYGVPTKAKPDFVMDMTDYVAAYDLKFTDNIYPRQWERIAKQLKYWMQDAHYSAVLEQHFGKPVSFRFWCCETRPPYRVHPYWFDRQSRKIASECHDRTMKDLSLSYKNNYWDDDWPNDLVIQMWDLKEADIMVEVDG